MQFKLHKNWDSPIQKPYSENGSKGFFAGREDELSLLSSDIERRDQGSILIRGHPGVGKTSLVLKTLEELEDAEIIPVFMSGPDMANLDGEIDAPRRMMSHLARRLYTHTRDEDLEEVDGKIERFYYKSVFNSKEILETELEESLSEEKGAEKDLELELSKKQKIKTAAVYSTPFIAGGLSFLVPINGIDTLIPQGLVPLIISAVTFPAVHLGYRRYSSWNEEREVKNRAKTLYERDSTIGNLKFELNEIHRELEGQKIVYVVDELDKVEPKISKKILKFFKNFFNSSNAVFIFIAGEDFKTEDMSSDRDKKMYRPRSSTYFNSKYFITKPRWEDLESYLSKILVEKDKEETTTLMKALCFEAENDFFSLKNEIKDRIAGFDDEGRAIIEERSDDYKKANMYDAITAFEDKYSKGPSNWEENEKITRRLFKIANEVHEGFVGEPINNYKKDNLLASISRDFYQYLHRYGLLDVRNMEKEKFGSKTKEIKHYRIQKTFIDEVPGKIEELTEFEQEFKGLLEDYLQYHVPFVNIGRELGGKDKISLEEFLESPEEYTDAARNYPINPISVFNKHKNLYNKMKENKTKEIERSEIEDRIEDLENQIKKLRTNLCDAFAKAYYEIGMHDTEAKIERIRSNNVNVDSRVQKEFNSENPYVLHNNANHTKPARLVIFTKREEIDWEGKLRKYIDPDTFRIVKVSEVENSVESVINLNYENPGTFDESVSIAREQLNEFFKSARMEEARNIVRFNTVKEAKKELRDSSDEILEVALKEERENKDRKTLKNFIREKMKPSIEVT